MSKMIKKGKQMAKTEKRNRWIDMLYYLAMAGLVAWYAYSKGWILADFPSVTPKQAITMLSNDDNVTLLDVRTIPEYKEGHLRDATLIPLDRLPENLNKLPKDKKILVYCRSGSRSISASRILKSHGYTPINIKEGIIGLSREHADIVK
jgi:rhodanese-related sulfurtransferase